MQTIELKCNQGTQVGVRETLTGYFVPGHADMESGLRGVFVVVSLATSVIHVLPMSLFFAYVLQCRQIVSKDALNIYNLTQTSLSGC